MENLEKQKRYVIKEEKMTELATAFISFLKSNFPSHDKAVFVTLSGNLGAGKTTFSKCIAKELGVEDSVTSPTFVIQKTYTTKDPQICELVHIDAYRFESADEVSQIGITETLKKRNTLVLLEWPEQIGEVAELADVKISLVVEDENTRVFSML